MNDGAFDLVALGRIAGRVIGSGPLVLLPDGAAAAIPGWDSLSHTIITLEIGAAFGVELSPAETARCRDFASFVALVNATISARHEP